MVDIKLVASVEQDFTNKTIRLLSKEKHELWSNVYKSEDGFNSAYRKIYK